MTWNGFRSWENNEKSENLFSTYESLKKIPNNRGPKAEFCGTPESTGKDENFIITCTNTNLDVK